MSVSELVYMYMTRDHNGGHNVWFSELVYMYMTRDHNGTIMCGLVN